MKSQNKKNSFKETFTFISTIISWTIFTLLIICAALLLYYFISTQIYARKGDKFEPKFSLYTIISPSMLPNIKVYDVIVNFRVDSPEEIKIGDVITFTSTSTESMGATVTHRVVSISKDENGNYSYQTKGDYNLVEDSSSVEYNNIIGRVGMKIPQLGRVQFFIASSYGWLFVVLLPALYIIFKDVFKILKLTNKDGKIYRILKTPLLPGKRLKLLPLPKLSVATNAGYNISEINTPDNIVISKETNDPISEINLVPDDVSDIDLNDLYENSNDEIDLDDLPTLK